jgi:hypothetical protein
MELLSISTEESPPMSVTVQQESGHLFVGQNRKALLVMTVESSNNLTTFDPLQQVSDPNPKQMTVQTPFPIPEQLTTAMDPYLTPPHAAQRRPKAIDPVFGSTQDVLTQTGTRISRTLTQCAIS